jgi:hypothetical protein
MKIIILVLTYLDDKIYSKFYEQQNKTWNSVDFPGVQTFFNINGGNSKEIKGHFIINDLPETISNEGYKIINCFEKTLDFDYDYIFHTNSSSYIDKELLYEWLLDKPRNNFYSGVVGKWHGFEFASGCGFALSKDLVKLILNNQNMWEHGTSDDATLGVMMSKLGIKVYPAPRFDLITTDIVEIPENYFHYRCKTNNRNFDIENMERIFNTKKEKIKYDKKEITI